jgi:GNAT superfamily N-acetyltransferase
LELGAGHCDLDSSWSWGIATDADAVHALLCASDAHHAQTYGLPAPARRIETTKRSVEAGAVHILQHGTEFVGMFSLTWEPSFDVAGTAFPERLKPAYLQRLAVRPDWLGSLVGLRCVRRAVELAAERGADALRADANPDLTATSALLRLFGFRQYGDVQSSESGLRRIHLEKELKPQPDRQPAAS